MKETIKHLGLDTLAIKSFSLYSKNFRATPKAKYRALDHFQLGSKIFFSFS